MMLVRTTKKYCIHFPFWYNLNSFSATIEASVGVAFPCSHTFLSLLLAFQYPADRALATTHLSFEQVTSDLAGNKWPFKTILGCFKSFWMGTPSKITDNFKILARALPAEHNFTLISRPFSKVQL